MLSTSLSEITASGLTLNWSNEAGNGHFYWGYYIGKEYAAKAFEYARKYCTTGTRLYVNDYNLESNPGKLAALIEFVKYIDENNATGQPIVDGIGTQMHVSTSITRAQVDAMFQTMAATGKLVRVTELDVQVGTTTPDASQLATQADVYQMIFESYKENIPTVQQSGITIWTLTVRKNMNIGYRTMHRISSMQATDANMLIRVYAMVSPDEISVKISVVKTGRIPMKQKENKLRLHKV